MYRVTVKNVKGYIVAIENLGETTYEYAVQRAYELAKSREDRFGDVFRYGNTKASFNYSVEAYEPLTL